MLQYDPSMLFSGSGNVIGNTLLNNYPTSPSSVQGYVDATNSLGALLQVWNIGGASVNTTNGLLYEVFSTSDGQWYDTTSYYSPLTIPTIANSIQRRSFLVETGKYLVRLTNTDPSNSINVMLTSGNLV